MSGEAASLSRHPRPIIPNAQLGTLLFIGSETVLVACLISTYIVLRLAAPAWPPPGTPTLHIGLAAFAAWVLIVSAITARVSNSAKSLGAARSSLFATLIFGIVFLALQTVELRRLFDRGLTPESGAFGALFYGLIGIHALHVIGGLLFMTVLIFSGADFRGRAEGLPLYWYFVTTAWLALFGILYIV